MKTIHFLCAATFALAMASCSSDENGLDTVGERVAVEFSASVGVTQTRAVDQTWSATDAIGIFMVKKDNELKAENISEKAANIRYVVDVTKTNGFKADGTAIYYPMDASPVDFYAYYPQGTVTSNATSGNYEYALNVANQSNQEAIDFMYSNNVKDKSKVNKDVALSFAHKLCKVVLTVQPGDGVEEPEMPKLGVRILLQKTTAVFDLTTGLINIDDTQQGNITLYKQGNTYVYEAILLPNSVPSRIFEFNLNNNVDAAFTWDMNKAMVGGNKYIYTVKLNRSGVVVTGTIAPWTENVEEEPVDAN